MHAQTTAPSPSAARGDAPHEKFPPGIPYIVGNEGAERFSYYGMRAILKIYLIALYLQFVKESDVSAGAGDP